MWLKDWVPEVQEQPAARLSQSSSLPQGKVCPSQGHGWIHWWVSSDSFRRYRVTGQGTEQDVLAATSNNSRVIDFPSNTVIGKKIMKLQYCSSSGSSREKHFRQFKILLFPPVTFFWLTPNYISKDNSHVWSLKIYLLLSCVYTKYVWEIRKPHFVLVP